ncbi:hypothetical protein M3T53_09625 [Actinomyces sp. B33]|uniref:hypothetical protein n=1 Tax=Actinomyces sp. B33 TaxID=2942131 RepID=UPI0023423E13|nr:hypothetical protein [Actinomyces sp. B33]MDC4233950.1 hypothetical protein [Actinomyces sp. B33]
MDPQSRGPGFATYVFVERIGRNAAALHPFPEHDIGLVRDALADAGLGISVIGPGAPQVGEGVYFQDEPFGDEVLGVIADSLTLRGIGAYAYALLEDDIGGESLALFTRVGDAFPREGRGVVMTRMFLRRGADGDEAVSWVYGAPADLARADALLSGRFSTAPVGGPSGMAAIEIAHPEFAAGAADPAGILDAIFQVLGEAGFEGPTFCSNAGGEAL